ncbi:hypothetical protein [Kushneria phosphatilytica]|uniref:hypothetical protein n=1 Tax=Kushneria phosphatilytica TaxID=657387 RepID=UPI00143A2425|nr:hypothetical protein [Kushneria phosphatilytica]
MTTPGAAPQRFDDMTVHGGSRDWAPAWIHAPRFFRRPFLTDPPAGISRHDGGALC